MSDSKSLILRLREQLQPRGTDHVVALHLDSHGMYNSDFISRCIDDLEKMPIRAALGDAPNNLEKLAYDLLLSSAYIDRKFMTNLFEKLEITESEEEVESPLPLRFSKEGNDIDRS